MRLIPLHDRAGNIVDYAQVDDVDFVRFGHLRWYRNARGYATRFVGVRPNRRSLLLHREILGLVRGDGKEGDHKDRDKLNNQRSNLRITTHAQNKQNLDPLQGKSSAYRNVSWYKRYGKWRVDIKINGKVRFLGYFDNELDADKAARDFRKTHMPYSTE